MDAHCQMIMDEFLEKRDSFEKMREIVSDHLHKLMKENNIYVTAIESRVKAQNSLEGKLELKGYKYSSLSDITDILGCRVITFYSNEVDKISSLIEKEFEIDWDNSEDKRRILDNDQFGYMSLHYICRIPKSIYFDENHPEINEQRFELQLRTALQHVWATAYHDTGYKSDVEVPDQYLRQLSRLAGLLEIADEQFSNILQSLTEYRRKVRDVIKNGDFASLELNGDTFSSYLEIGPFEKLNSKIAAINRAEIEHVSLKPYLHIFKQFGLRTIADLDNMIKENEHDAYRLVVLQLGGTDLDILAESVGVQAICDVFIIKKGFGLVGLKAIRDELYGEKPRNARAAKKILEHMQTLGLAGLE